MYKVFLVICLLVLMVSSRNPSTSWVSRNTDLPELDGLRIHYLYGEPPANETAKGTFLLIHGFPYTSHHFRHVIKPLTTAGYRVIAPDYRGAGKSSKPTGFADEFRKTTLAADLFHLVHDVLGVSDKIHVVGHDIGAMVAHAYATRHAEHVASVAWGECVMPGTREYDERKTRMDHFQLMFHRVPDLPEALLAGREADYVRFFFFDRQAYNRAALDESVGVYAADYAQPGAVRCGLGLYRALEDDKAENLEWRARNGKSAVPALALSGKRSFHAADGLPMLSQLYEDVETAEMDEVGHYLAEEDPVEFVRILVDWAGRHAGK